MTEPMPKTPDIVVAALYKFAPLANLDAVKQPLLETCLRAGLFGTLILAPEGINGTIAGSRSGIESVLDHIRRLPGCRDLHHKISFANDNPFLRMKVRLKTEIVTMGIRGIDPTDSVGTYVEAEDWNDLISDPNVIVIDTRNDYEVGIGSFEGAVDPQTTSFRDFPNWFRANRAALAGSKFAMYCTGGIRCEKATAFLKKEGIDEVYHLRGGILKYLETIDEHSSLWQGQCFVFDQRVSVGHGLALGSYEMCYACRWPIAKADKASNHYVPGVSCPKCHDKHSDAQKQRFQERQRQIERAKRRGTRHLGAVQNPNVEEKIGQSE